MDISLLILSEYNRSPCNYPSWASISYGRCSIALTTIAGIGAEESGSGPGFAWLRLGNVRAFSCYWTPNGDSAADRLEAFKGFLDGLDQAIRQGERENETLLVAGDFNAKSTYWGSSVDDSKGEEALESFAASLGLWTNNVGSHPTFQRGASSSVIDVTFSGPGPYEVVDWELDEGQPFLEEPVSAADAAEVLNNYLVNACDSCMPRRVYEVHKRKAVHWWNHEIADLRAKCIRNRRIYLIVVKRQGPNGSTAERIAFREARKALRASIRKSQKLSWAALCTSVNNDPWGVPYRIVSGRLSRQPPGISAIRREKEIADHLFPTMPIINWQRVPMDSQVDPNFTTTTAEGYNFKSW
ncbi:hypothetical protein QTP88_012549 [Uroleucon formosanum]